MAICKKVQLRYSSTLRYMIKSVAAIFFYSAPAESTNDK